MATIRKTAKQLERADRTLTHKAASRRDTPAMRVAAAVGELADQPPLIALSAATLAIGLVLRRRVVAEAGARMLTSHLLATGVKTAVKRSIDRTRPHSVDGGKDYKLERGSSRSHDDSSFPSGHTAGAVAVARAASRVWPAGKPALAATAVGFGAVQLPIGKHYGSDVLAGAAIGLASEWIVDAAWNVLRGGPAEAKAPVADDPISSRTSTAG